jgi:biotin carboxyl carrier protein
MEYERMQVAREMPSIRAVSADPAPASDTAALAMQLQAAVLRERQFAPAAVAFVTGLAAGFGFDRVSLGMAEDGYCRVLAISHGTPGEDPSAVHRSLGAAMDEALEQGLTLCAPPPNADPQGIALAHEALVRRHGGIFCTVPLAASGEPVGAVCFERHGEGAIDPVELERLEHVLCLLGPVLHLLRLNERTIGTRFADAARATLDRLRAPERRRPRIGLGAGVLALVLLLFLPVERHIGGRARVEGVVQRVLVAPTEGFIQATHVRPGDQVQSGQILAELADKDLRLEQRKWASQLAQQENAHASAMARSDRAQAVINLAKASEAEAQLALAETRLARAQIEAPFDGVVIQGDLTQSIGAPVKQGDALMTVARGDGFRVIVEIDERDILPVRVGQPGSLALSALPWDALPIRITRVTPLTGTVEGANVFEVEAEFVEQPADVRPGLRGVAKITAGEQPLLLGWTRRLLDWARLWLWTWVG